MGKDIYKKGLILLGVIVVATITFFGYKLQSNNDNNVVPFNQSELNELDEVKQDNNLDELEKSKEDNNGEDNSNLSDYLKESASIVIDISGAVKNPGIYELGKGSRLNDAIEASGGIAEDSNTEYISKNINKARILNDEEKIYIPFKNDDLSLIENIEIENSKNANSTNTKSSSETNYSSLKININTASKEELIALKGIGDAFAQRIIDYREDKKFTKIEDIKNVKGIGEKTFENIKDKITVK